MSRQPAAFGLPTAPSALNINDSLTCLFSLPSHFPLPRLSLPLPTVCCVLFTRCIPALAAACAERSVRHEIRREPRGPDVSVRGSTDLQAADQWEAKHTVSVSRTRCFTAKGLRLTNFFWPIGAFRSINGNIKMRFLDKEHILTGERGSSTVSLSTCKTTRGVPLQKQA